MVEEEEAVCVHGVETLVARGGDSQGTGWRQLVHLYCQSGVVNAGGASRTNGTETELDALHIIQRSTVESQYYTVLITIHS